MADSPIPVIESAPNTPKVRVISSNQPWEWLGAGWKDLWQAPAISVPYGLIFVILGYILVYTVSGRFQYVLGFTSGFLLAGPFLALGFYDISRRLEAGQTPSLGQALTAWRRNASQILMVGLGTLILVIIWAQLTGPLFAVIVSGHNLTTGDSINQLFFSGSGLTFLLVFLAIGAVLAALLFVCSVVSIPMLLDRKTDFITAILTSIAAVRHNPGPMLLWALLIVIFSGIGLLTFYIGLAIAMPLLGHATWHAYRALVDADNLEAEPL